MTLEGALNHWLTHLTGIDAYWLERPDGADHAIVYRCISPGMLPTNLCKFIIHNDSYSISLYHDNPDIGKAMADLIVTELHDFAGALNPQTEFSYPIQLITFSGGFDQRLATASGQPCYQFNRDFVINH